MKKSKAKDKAKDKASDIRRQDALLNEYNEGETAGAKVKAVLAVAFKKKGRGRSGARRLADPTLPAEEDGKTTAKGRRKASAKKRSGKSAIRPARGGKKPLRLIWVEAGSLADNPANWRRHPEGQLRAIRASIAEDWAGALLYNEATGRLIDGHARKAAAGPKAIVPVLVGRWSEDRERRIMATLDPLAAMAETNAAALEDLLSQTQLDAEDYGDVQDWLEEAVKQAQADLSEARAKPRGGRSQGVGDLFSVIVECRDEKDQLAMFERMKKEGRKCKLYVL